MELIDIQIDVVEVYDRSDHTVKVFHLWEHVGGTHKVEWYISEDGKHHAIYWPDAYYDVDLQKRHETGNMICPQDKSKRLILVGYLTGQVDLEPGTYFEVLRNRVNLTGVAEDEK